MRKTLALTLALMTAALLAGCVSPTPQEAQNAKDARAVAEKLLTGFAGAMQAKEPLRLQGLLSASLSTKQGAPLAFKLQAASWLKSYSGYTLDAGPALDRVSWREWNAGLVQLTVPVTNGEGTRFMNKFVLARQREGWCIRDFTVAMPKKGDPLDPPAAVVEQIRPAFQQTIKALREGHMAEIWYNLPEDRAARYRMPVPTFWQKIGFESSEGPISIYEDLGIVKTLPIAGWPDPAEAPDLTWLAPGAMLSTYELQYGWEAGTGAQTVRMEITFLKHEAGWGLYMIRFYGDPIPSSE